MTEVGGWGWGPPGALWPSGGPEAVGSPRLLVNILLEWASDQQLLISWLFLHNFHFLSH